MNIPNSWQLLALNNFASSRGLKYIRIKHWYGRKWEQFWRRNNKDKYHIWLVGDKFLIIDILFVWYGFLIYFYFFSNSCKLAILTSPSSNLLFLFFPFFHEHLLYFYKIFHPSLLKKKQILAFYSSLSFSIWCIYSFT